MKSRVAFVSFIILVVVNLVIREPAVAFNATKPVKCSEPAKEDARVCREVEQQILSSTVRITIESWVVEPGDAGYDIDYSVGHATVMDGRYLVTHNHFNVPLPDELAGGAEAYGIVYLYNSSGQRVFKGPLSEFELVVEAGETLVFAHKDEGFFETLGFSSAEFGAWMSPPIETGMEVAQVDWDGETTRVDWVEVKEVVLEAGAPRLVLADSVWPGASGAGIFWQGIHVANNWLFQAKITESGATFDEVTSAALNPLGVLEL